eukprot:scaffold6730_cov198-Amphora_coffeaeformis.AAC.2
MSSSFKGGEPLYIGNLPRFTSEECVVMDLFGPSIAWDCPITQVHILKHQQQQQQQQPAQPDPKKEVQAIVWIVAGGDDQMEPVTVDQIINNLDRSNFRGKTIEVRMATQAEEAMCG